ncbi:LysR family transcriptional regulator [Rhizobium leguminosarum]|jgi:DNA-binding transcriptional LysR family regulator|uniref:LysR family transcriptional regulator n=1 Tax=Rhizobium leguminosarum TaxID=384 RepID=UPI000FEC2970|nr:LysR family transcriptional regulator [Rhizobium leguminosarum]MBY2951670.1 LysR family transcriptional regulator [Rhizobium leguminosarum]MBY2967188.1 LysR family transcriptional regulator [Rhizobium leguminosarum]MBY2993692.1 LysR family transcriptional regulator [Rhizobium leguminosarum]MBY3061036.1 LysR family transcriptional regulator [Rhizobium leguminosarum]RWX30304.1 LysR family transcriptional regulator [Rhizobium leguminosarum]
MKIDERHLVQLAAVVKTGGVTEGAALLGLSQPAVSRTLAMLEARIGEPLFVKGRRPLQPTSLGRALADHGQTMLSASRKASDVVESFRAGRSGVVRVGGTPFFMDALIAGMIAEFQNLHPDVRIDQSYGYFPDLRAALNADQIDLAICPIDILDEGSGLEFQQILPGRNVVACRVTHPLLLKRRPQPAHLLDFPWVAPPPGSPLLTDLRSMLLSFGATEVKIRYSGGSLMSVVQYMKAADALTIMPHSVVFALRNEKSITALPVPIPHSERALGLLKRSDAPRTPAADNFARHIRTSFDNLKHLIKRHEQSVVWGS